MTAKPSRHQRTGFELAGGGLWWVFPNTVVGKDHLALSLRFPEEAGGFDA
jgi:hypothetical protein